MKLKSCMTLFAALADGAEGKAPFEAVLRRYYGGEQDAKTLALLP